MAIVAKSTSDMKEIPIITVEDKFDDSDKFDIVEYYKSNPHLWLQTDPNYGRGELKSQCKHELTAYLAEKKGIPITVETLSKCWENMRRMYRRERQKLFTAPKGTPWRFFPYMQFLDENDQTGTMVAGSLDFSTSLHGIEESSEHRDVDAITEMKHNPNLRSESINDDLDVTSSSNNNRANDDKHQLVMEMEDNIEEPLESVTIKNHQFAHHSTLTSSSAPSKRRRASSNAMAAANSSQAMYMACRKRQRQCPSIVATNASSHWLARKKTPITASSSNTRYQLLDAAGAINYLYEAEPCSLKVDRTLKLLKETDQYESAINLEAEVLTLCLKYEAQVLAPNISFENGISGDGGNSGVFAYEATYNEDNDNIIDNTINATSSRRK